LRVILHFRDLKKLAK